MYEAAGDAPVTDATVPYSGSPDVQGRKDTCAKTIRRPLSYPTGLCIRLLSTAVRTGQQAEP